MTPAPTDAHREAEGDTIRQALEKWKRRAKRWKEAAKTERARVIEKHDEETRKLRGEISALNKALARVERETWEKARQAVIMTDCSDIPDNLEVRKCCAALNRAAEEIRSRANGNPSPRPEDPTVPSR